MFLQGPHGRLVDVGHVLHADVACRFPSECVDKKKEMKRKRKISKRKEEDRVNGCALGPPTASGLALSWSRFSHRSEHTKTAKHEQEQTNDNDRLPESRRVSPFIGTILMMQSPIHGTWPPIGNASTYASRTKLS